MTSSPWFCVLLVAACAAGDRLRGGILDDDECEDCDVFGEILYAVALCVLLGVPLAWIGWGVAAWILGGRPGWGYPMGWVVNGEKPGPRVSPGLPTRIPRPEWWQWGRLKDWPLVSLVARGAMWGIPLAPALKFAAKRRWALPIVLFAIAGTSAWLWSNAPALAVLPAAMALAMPAGAMFDAGTGLGLNEWVRGTIMGCLCWAAGMAIAA